MGYYTCPIATVHAPPGHVWNLLSNPAQYALWWDARTCFISPEGPAISGQKILARSKALGREWDVQINVESVDEARHVLQLTSALPLGITVHNHITCTALDESTSRVTFG